MALKTNSKIVRDRIRKFIIDNVEVDNYSPKYDYFEEARENGEDTKKLLVMAKDIIKTTFYEEKLKFDNRRLSHSEFFKEWLQGLPSTFDCEFFYKTSATKLLGDILEESEEERERFTEMDAENLLVKLIYREIF